MTNPKFVSKVRLASLMAVVVLVISTLSLPVVAGVFEQVNAEAASGRITVHPLRGGVTELEGSGGNITVLTGSDGKFMVEAGIALSKKPIQNALDTLGAGSVKYVVNTHWHWDHSDGDAWLHEAGALVIATPNTAKHLAQASRVTNWNHTFPPVTKDGMPTILLTAAKTYNFDGDNIVVTPLAPSHTDGDISVYFTKEDVLATGDTFWNGFYPYIDYEHGGKINGTISAVDSYLVNITDHTLIVPGHGAVGNKAQLKAFRDMLVGIRDRVAMLKAQGKTLDQVVASKPTAPFDAQWGGFIVKPDLFAKIVYLSL
ncbi:MBL fold metallo-hydrolase [Rhodanobacter sp. MP7CTX1]|uniref:MBL fold metallo-hydrolase n=1 Tax=Rhodanobacter sp. MP7CTX1 TaxID=2723084 RepID=UPI00180A6839|nr:glyoxylase-like metal-dependent hydrolase (beta-lactamase superfamily II) [Rhodanobacter sp. MP7CTX1]